MKNVLKQLAKRVLISLKLMGFGHPSDLASRTATMMIWNKEMNDIMKIVNSPEESGLLIRAVYETIKNVAEY